MPTRRLVLASASPARLGLLRGAGFAPDVQVSGVDESTVTGTPAEQVLELARLKAHAVAPDHPDAVVVGCDSMLELDGQALGKPADEAEAVARWQQMRGRSGTLLTGHCIIDGERSVAEVAATVVRFGIPTDDEVRAYVASGEPLHVAGAFTLDGRSGPFVDGIDGCHSNVVGLSLPLLRSMLQELGVRVVDLWS